MEPDSAFQMFNDAPKQAVKFSFYTGDDDSTTEAHVRQNVSYGVEKFSDIIHMKKSLTKKLYNLSQNAKFEDSSTLSQKVIDYLVKCLHIVLPKTMEMPKQFNPTSSALFPALFGIMKTVVWI